MKKFKQIVVAIYVDPDFYPPTINAVLNLAEHCEKLILISRNNCEDDFDFPKNVEQVKIGKCCSVREMEQQNYFYKIKYFNQFAYSIYKYGKQSDTDLIVLYDHIALYAWSYYRNLMPKKKLWYHNHDMPSKSMFSTFSIGGRAAKYEHQNLNLMDYFTLPNLERKKFYPNVKSDVRFFVLPNFPSKKVYQDFEKSKTDKTIRLIFQGFVSTGRLLEQTIELLPEKINGYDLELFIKGPIAQSYKDELISMAKNKGVESQLNFFGISSYKKVQEVTRQASIGIGVNMKADNISQNMTTASNKIFEYAACKLPVIVSDTEQFRAHLEKYPWVYFTDGSVDSLRNILEKIIPSQLSIGEQGFKDFNSGLNFETGFQKIISEITD